MSNEVAEVAEAAPAVVLGADVPGGAVLAPNGAPAAPAMVSGNGLPDLPANFSGNFSDFARDMANIQAELGQKPPAASHPPAPVPIEPPALVPGPDMTVVPVPPPAEPIPAPEPALTAPTTPVPAKFQNPDGTVNDAALAKSQLHADAALAKYRETERELRRAQNEAARARGAAASQPPASLLPGQAPQDQAGAPAPQPESFAALLERDVKQYGIGP